VADQRHPNDEEGPSGPARCGDGALDPTSPSLGASGPEPDPPTGSERFLNRELSWLEFNARVLALAEDRRTPLLERAKFIAICSQNLDEFFQVRVAGLKDQVAAGITRPTPDGRTPVEQLTEIRERVVELVSRQERVFLDDIVPALADRGVRFATWDELGAEDREFLTEEFEKNIFPVLTPLAVDPGHPFPYISDLSLNLAAIVRDPEADERRFARVKVPSALLPRFVALPDGERFVALEQVIAAHLDTLFPGMVIESHHPFRVTRNADLTLEDEDAEDLLAAVEMELRRRRFGRAVRVEVDSSITDEVRELLCRELDIEDEDLYAIDGPLDLSGLWTLHGLDRPDLLDPVWTPVTQHRLMAEEEPLDIFAEIRRGDLLFHLPYSSFSSSVEEFIRQAAADPDVQAIKLTLYRTSGDSPIVHSLIRAAEDGKQVAALVELKARFDEKANVEWARRLEEAGVHVTYGLAGLKVHTKIAFVVRRETDGIRRYCHVGTGNYNPKTARIYEDFGLLTCDPAVGNDVTHLFNYLTGYAREVAYERLLVAPDSLRAGLEALVRGEMKVPSGAGHIVMKANSLSDPDMIDLLYEASCAGVEIDLVIRGICALRPGVPGLSENIRVRSLVGRYLEHSRVFFFANGGGVDRPAFLMGSADLMPRNLDRRVEAVVPVADHALQERLAAVLKVLLDDDALAWSLSPSGRWDPPPDGTENTHDTLEALALDRGMAR
jgi:polyphosphate kinase